MQPGGRRRRGVADVRIEGIGVSLVGEPDPNRAALHVAHVERLVCERLSGDVVVRGRRRQIRRADRIAVGDNIDRAVVDVEERAVTCFVVGPRADGKNLHGDCFVGPHVEEADFERRQRLDRDRDVGRSGGVVDRIRRDEGEGIGRGARGRHVVDRTELGAGGIADREIQVRCCRVADHDEPVGIGRGNEISFARGGVGLRHRPDVGLEGGQKRGILCQGIPSQERNGNQRVCNAQHKPNMIQADGLARGMFFALAWIAPVPRIPPL